MDSPVWQSSDLRPTSYALDVKISNRKCTPLDTHSLVVNGHIKFQPCDLSVGGRILPPFTRFVNSSVRIALSTPVGLSLALNVPVVSRLAIGRSRSEVLCEETSRSDLSQ